MGGKAAKLLAVAAAGAGGLWLWHRYSGGPRLVLPENPLPQYAGEEGFGLPEGVTLVPAEDPVTLTDLATGARTLPDDPAKAAATIGFAPLYTSLETVRRIQSGLASLVTGDIDMAERPGPEAPRGIRNHNPGNIKQSAIPWRGQVTGDDPVFVTFASPEWGIRAMFRTLHTYQADYGLRSVREMVSRWAPPDADGNHTAEYIAYVASKAGVSADEPIDLSSDDALRVVAAMIEFENGVSDPYPMALIHDGQRMANLS